MKKYSLILFLLCACGSENTITRQAKDFKDTAWYINDTPSFTFEIEDSSIAYTISYNVRYTLTYPFHNLYLTHYLVDTNAKSIHQSLDELFLFDPISGKPKGNGLGDIFDYEAPLFKKFYFPKKGKYTFKIKQYMRQNPLTDLISVGITIKKAEP